MFIMNGVCDSLNGACYCSNNIRILLLSLWNAVLAINSTFIKSYTPYYQTWLFLILNLSRGILKSF